MAETQSKPSSTAIKVRYPGQPDDEKTLRIFYKSWAAIAPVFIAGVLLFAAGLLAIGYGTSTSATFETFLPGTPFGFSIATAGLLVVMATAFFVSVGIWVWRGNHLVVTNEHIADVSQRGIFNRAVATLTLQKIQDVKAEVAGPLQTVFQYGTVTIQTAGEQKNFVIDYLSQPYAVEKYILEVHEEYADEDAMMDGVAPTVAPTATTTSTQAAPPTAAAKPTPVAPPASSGDLQPGQEQKIR